MLKKEEIEIIKSECSKYEFETLEYNCMMIIKSKFGSWIIRECESGYELLHRNTMHRINGKFYSDIDGYHKQTECKDTSNLLNIIEYLHKHDKAQSKRYHSKKTSVDRMFSKIKNPDKFVIT